MRVQQVGNPVGNQMPPKKPGLTLSKDGAAAVGILCGAAVAGIGSGVQWGAGVGLFAFGVGLFVFGVLLAIG